MGFRWDFFFFAFPLPMAGYQSNLVCIKSGLLLRVFGFWYPIFKSFENEIFSLKSCRSIVVLHEYGHEMI